MSTYEGRYVSMPYMQPNGAVYVETLDRATGSTRSECPVVYADDYPGCYVLPTINGKFALTVKRRTTP